MGIEPTSPGCPQAPLKTFPFAGSADGYMHFAVSLPVVWYSLSPIQSIQANLYKLSPLCVQELRGSDEIRTRT